MVKSNYTYRESTLYAMLRFSYSGISYKRLLRLTEINLSIHSILNEPQSTFDGLVEKKILTSQQRQKLLSDNIKASVDKAMKWKKWKNTSGLNHHIISIEDKIYPEILRQINTPPIILFAKGSLSCLNKKKIAIVGTRNSTKMGQENAFLFSTHLASKGFIIVSGLATGIDSFAHEGAIKEGETIAVLGTGIDVVYPKSNKALFDKVIDKGLIVSEFPLGAQPTPYNFPQRNRIISGLSLGTLVVEADIYSGAMSTAGYALEQNREVFAIPSSIHNPNSKGCHLLIKQGAKLTESISDILDELPYSMLETAIPQKHVQDVSTSNKKINKSSMSQLIPQTQSEFSNSTEKENSGTNLDNISDIMKKILESLNYDNFIDIDGLVASTGLSISDLAVNLLSLEMLSLVSVSGNRYMRKAQNNLYR